MKVKHRIVEIVTIVALMALIVFMVKSCGKSVQAIEEPNEPILIVAETGGIGIIDCDICQPGESDELTICPHQVEPGLVYEPNEGKRLEAIEARLDALDEVFVINDCEHKNRMGGYNCNCWACIDCGAYSRNGVLIIEGNEE